MMLIPVLFPDTFKKYFAYSSFANPLFLDCDVICRDNSISQNHGKKMEAVIFGSCCNTVIFVRCRDLS